jgi:hypothetical protein
VSARADDGGGPSRRTFLGDAKDHNQHFRVDPFFDLAGYSTVIPETRLNRLQHRLQSCGASMQQRNLFSGFAHISAFGAMFELPKVVTDTATQMLFEFSKRIDGVNFGSDSFAVSVCYLALEKHLCVKPIREVAAVSGIDEKSLRKCLKKLRKTIPPAAKKFWFTLLSSTNWTARALSALCSLALMNKV